MEKQKSIKANMLMSIILTSSNFLFPLVTYAYVARILSTDGTGKISFVQSVLAFFSYIASLGITNYGIRECARVRDDKKKLSTLVQELLIINMGSTVIAYILLFFTLLSIQKFQDYKMLFYVMSLSLILQTLGIEWLYNATEMYAYITVRSIVFKFISVVLTFLFVKDANDFLQYGAITIFATSASNILNFFNARKYIFNAEHDVYNLQKHMRPILVFFGTSIIITIYAHCDTTMLGFMKGDGAVGIYSAALKIKTVILSVSTAITSVLIPRMSVYYSEGRKEEFNALIVKSLRVTLTFMMPLLIFVSINAEDILLFVCGEDFISAKNTLIIMMISVIELALTNLLGNQILVPKGNEKRYSQSVFIGFWVNIVTNTLLIPKISTLGAAIATLLTELFNAIWMGAGCKEEIKFAKKNISILQYGLPLSLSAILVVIAQRFVLEFHSMIRLAILGILYFGVFYGIMILIKEPIFMSGLSAIRQKVRMEKAKQTFT